MESTLEKQLTTPRRYQVGVEQGDIEFAGYAAMHSVVIAFAVGQPLAQLQIHLTSYRPGSETNQAFEAGIHFIEICWQTVLNLIQRFRHPGYVIGSSL